MAERRGTQQQRLDFKGSADKNASSKYSIDEDKKDWQDYVTENKLSAFAVKGQHAAPFSAWRAKRKKPSPAPSPTPGLSAIKMP